MAGYGTGKGNRKGLIIGITAGVLAVAGIIAAIALIPRFKRQKVEIPEEYLVETVDAENELRELGEIRSVQNAKRSKKVHTEKQAAENLASRGFTQAEISSEYSINGDYYTEKEVSKNSKTKHPAYDTYYVTSQNMVWYITEINGRVFAVPSSYNATGRNERFIIVSESDSMISYDSKTNNFYELVPFDDSEILLITVDRIDSDTLENFAF